MARYLVLGCASIYLWKNVRKTLSKDNYKGPINILSGLGNLMNRLSDRTNFLNTNVYLDDIQSMLGRILNCVPNFLMTLNNGLKFEEKFEDNHKQPPISINKTCIQLNQDKIEPKKPTSNFNDIKGFDSAKNDLISYISTFKIGPSSCLDQKSLTKGCVLYGPPKFERTILVHALAGEMKMGLFEISSLSLDGSFYCNGKKIEDVNEIVKQASKSSPCILLFDNYDCYNDDNTEFLSSLIIELDKCEASKRIAVIVATSSLQNVPRNVSSLTRFGMIVQLVDHLNFNKRKEIFLYHTSNIPIDASIDVDLVISATVGMNARQIKYLVGRSARKAKLQNRCKVTTQDVCYTLLMEKLKTSKKITRPTYPPPAIPTLPLPPPPSFAPPPVPTRPCPPPPFPSPIAAPRKKNLKTTTKLQQYTSQFNFDSHSTHKQMEEPIIR